LIKKFNQAFSAILAACVLFTSVPVNALSAGESNTEQQTLDELNTENIASKEESNATSTEVATDSNATEDTSISDISSNDVDSSKEKLNNEISLQSDNTEDDEETSTDNWELGLVFYDSTVDNGKTPLTSIDWDASDGGYGAKESRVITVQINYKNTNAVTTYNPEELTMEIPNLIYGTAGRSGTQWSTSVIVGANDSTHSNYDWNFATASAPTDRQQSYKFTNARTIEEKANFEGSIQIVYTITPTAETYNNMYFDGWDDGTLELYKDECTHTLDRDLQVTLSYPDKSEEKQTTKNLLSDEIHFYYTRTYIHPWVKPRIAFTKSASKITSYDRLGETPENYTWVKYGFGRNGFYRSNYPNISMRVETTIVYDAFPKECKVILPSGKVLEPSNTTVTLPTGEELSSNEENLLYALPYSVGSTVYVGYPKEIYNIENNNMNFTNTAYYYGRYSTEKNVEYLNQASININLNNFDFYYTGELYGITKSKMYDSLYYQYIRNGGSTVNFNISAVARYTGHPMTIKWGEDLLYATDLDGNTTKLSDEDYSFQDIFFLYSDPIMNGNNVGIGNDIQAELWIRCKGETEYKLFAEDTAYNLARKYGWGSSDAPFMKGDLKDKVVGFYFIFKNVNESFNISSVRPSVKFNKREIPETGELHNFTYLQVYFENEDGTLSLQNEPGRDSYADGITQEIADYDQETYGTYMQRATAKYDWKYYDVPSHYIKQGAKKVKTGVTQDAENEKFTGSFYLSAPIDCRYLHADWLYQYKDSDTYDGFVMYDLLPEGMELESTVDDIKNSMGCSVYDHYDYQSDYTHYGYSNPTDYSKYTLTKVDRTEITQEELKACGEKNTKIDIIKNWHNTGRTMVKIEADLSELKIIYGSPCLYYRIDYSVSYDAFLEYGNIYRNNLYIDHLDKEKKILGFDSLSSMKDTLDINENGDVDEYIRYVNQEVVITSVISTYQDVTKYVQTDKSNYSTGTVKASPDSEYTYKLRVRTGKNDVTNLVIYDSIEEYAQDKDGNIVPAYGRKKHWNGEFLGVDTSYAEKKGYKVKVYYSEDKQAGNLSEDNSWKEYSDSVDKTKVKSLAFEYLNKDDETQKAVLPANSQTYVLVKMKAPPEENRKVLAYNGCRTQWQALDDYDRPVDFITGINSNIVKVTLSEYFDLTVNKIWDDENNKWGLRPDSIDIILKKSGVEIERKQITPDNLSVTFTDLLSDDAKFYTIEEEVSPNYNASIEYNELEDCYEVTNTLKDDIFTNISGTKKWVNDKESNRPESITIKLLKDGEVYRTTTTNAEKEWKYSFEKVPIYNIDGTECIYSVEEVPVDRYSVQYTTPSNGLAIKFDNQFKFEGSSTDYIEIYYKDKENNIYKIGKYGSTSLAGKTVNIPSKDFYIYFYSDGSVVYYGYKVESITHAMVDENSITRTKVTSLPSGTLTELSGNNYPETEHNYKNSQRLLWHYTGASAEGYDIINTYEGIDTVGLSFVKVIEGTDEAFEKLQLEKDALYKFQVSMKNRETNDIIYVPINNKNTATVSEVPIGTYIITEKDDMYFDFVSMEALNSVEGVTFEKVSNDYVLTITDAASDDETLQIKVNNKIEPDRPYEDKEERVNLFDWTSDENSEEASLLSRIANFFTN